MGVRSALPFAAVLVLVLCAVEAGFAAASATNGEPTSLDAPIDPGILPVALGNSPDCDQSDGNALGNGVYPEQLFVAAFGSGCTPSADQPLLWTMATGMIRLALPPLTTTGNARGVSDEGVVVGFTWGPNAVAWFRPPGGPTETLPLLAGTLYSTADAIAPGGRFVAGENNDETTWDLVRWELVEGEWTVESLETSVGVGLQARAVSDAGTVVAVANWLQGSNAQAWLYESGEAPLALPGERTQANGISRDGSVVVGAQWRPCDAPCNFYPAPVYWMREPGGDWTMHDLEALDGVDSVAAGVAEVDGSKVIVGRGFTKSDEIRRAVAWIPGAGGSYGAPIRLAAVDGKSNYWALATDVNEHGVVVGTSEVPGSSRTTVLWFLPQPKLIFLDGFESGDSCVWSSSEGGGSCP